MSYSLQHMLFTPSPTEIYALDPAQMQAGDVVLTSRSGLFSTLIRRATRSQFSHAALVTRQGSLIEAVMRGVVRRSLLGVWVARPNWICVLRPPSGVALFSAAGLSLATVAEEGFSNPYSLLGAVGTKLTWLKALRGQGYFCSELVAAAFAECNYPLASTEPSTVSPEVLRSSGRLNDVTAQCVRTLKLPQKDWQLVLDVSKVDHPAGEARVLRSAFRAFKAGVSVRVLPKELHSTPAVIGWLMSLDRRQRGIAAADETISRVLEYGGYARWFIERSARDILGGAAQLGALLAMPQLLEGTRQSWAQQLASATVVLNDRATQSLRFQRLFAQNNMQTARVLHDMYRSMEEDANVRVRVLQRLVNAST